MSKWIERSGFPERVIRLPKFWGGQLERYRMVGEICRKCGGRIFPPRDKYPYCCENVVFDASQSRKEAPEDS